MIACRRRSASRWPRLPFGRQASASFTMRSLSAALKTRRALFGTVSRVALLSRVRRRSLCGEASWLEIRDGFGTICDPFSAHRYLGFEGELSHPTLARGGRVAAGGARKNLHRQNFAQLHVFQGSTDVRNANGHAAFVFKPYAAGRRSRICSPSARPPCRIPGERASTLLRSSSGWRCPRSLRRLCSSADSPSARRVMSTRLVFPPSSTSRVANAR